MEEIILQTSELAKVENSKAEQIKKTFEPMVRMLKGFEKSYEEVIAVSEKEITKEVIVKAKRVRLDISKVRIETEKARRLQKEEYLRAGKAIDGVANILKWAVVEKEEKLKEIEKYFEIQEKKRLEELQQKRAELLSKYVDDAFERDLSSMDEDVWESYLFAKKKAYEDKIIAEKKAEEERIAREKAEAKERERIRKENERLRKEAKERERQAKIEAEKRREYELKLEKERKKRERIERIEREKRLKLEAELKAKIENSQLQTKNIKEDDKVKLLISDLLNIKKSYVFRSKENQKMFNDVCVLIDKTVEHIVVKTGGM